MRVKTARAILSATWVGGSVPLLILVAIQTLDGVYGKDSDKGALWIIPLLLPVLGMICGALSVGHVQSDDSPLSSVSFFWITMTLIVAYFIILYSSMIIGWGDFPDEHVPWDSIISKSTWILSSLQWVISITLTKFFIENIRLGPKRKKG
jgi:hypothetical protein